MLAEVPVITTRKAITTDGAPCGIAFDAVVLKPVEDVFAFAEVDCLRQFGKAASSVTLSYYQSSRLFLERGFVSRINPLRVYLFYFNLALDEVNAADFDEARTAASTHVEHVPILPRVVHVPVLATRYDLTSVVAPFFLEHCEIVDSNSAARILEKLCHNIPIEHSFLHLFSPFSSSSSLPSSSVSACMPIPHRLSCPATLESSSSCGQPFVSESLAVDCKDETVEPSESVFCDIASVQAERNLVNIAAKMLRANVVPCAIDAPLQQCPNTLNRVRVDLASRILPAAMVDGAVIEPKAVQTLIAACLVSVNHRTGLHVIMDGLMQRAQFGAFDHHATDAASGALTHSEDDGFTNGAATHVEFLVLMLVLFLAADESRIGFNIALERRVERIGTGGMAKAMKHEPRVISLT
jgi:hypothetical protein